MTETHLSEGSPIRVGVSSCLLGNTVRYNGGHKHSGYVTETLGRYFELVPFCPEVAIGLGVPRPPIRLVRSDGGVRARGVADPGLDVTDRLTGYGEEIAGRVAHFCGYILKKGSPSCGMERVKIYSEQGMPVGKGAGIFAATLMERQPLMPIEEEGRLMDPVLRENFIERVFVYHRWQQLIDEGLTAAALVEFHTEHKLSIMAHDEVRYRALGRVVARAGTGSVEETAAEYVAELMAALRRPATRKRHANVLMHVLGYIKQHMDAEDKRELLELIDEYRLGRVPLIVPITLLKHHLRRYPEPYIDRQHYLNPHPRELMLRNNV